MSAGTDRPAAPRPTLVLVHGWGMHPGVWGGFATALQRDFEVRALALPGHGEAPRRPGWTVEALAAEWRERFPGACWLGWSLGAQVALAAAASPSDVRRLVLVGATPRFVAGRDWPCAMPGPRFATFEQGCADDPRATLERFLALQVLGSDQARDTLRILQHRCHAVPPPSPAALLDALAVLRSTDQRDMLPGVTCPTLWLTGERDRLCPPGAARWAAGNQPRGRVSCLPGAGHAPFVSHQDALLDLTRQWFLDSIHDPD